MLKSGNIKPLNGCPLCHTKNVFATYEESQKYRYECKSCGQYFEFNACSQLAADIIFNQIISKEGIEK